jgi:hypothetical protein
MFTGGPIILLWCLPSVGREKYRGRDNFTLVLALCLKRKKKQREGQNGLFP